MTGTEVSTLELGNEAQRLVVYAGAEFLADPAYQLLQRFHPKASIVSKGPYAHKPLPTVESLLAGIVKDTSADARVYVYTGTHLPKETILQLVAAAKEGRIPAFGLIVSYAYRDNWIAPGIYQASEVDFRHVWVDNTPRDDVGFPGGDPLFR